MCLGKTEGVLVCLFGDNDGGEVGVESKYAPNIEKVLRIVSLVFAVRVSFVERESLNDFFFLLKDMIEYMNWNFAGYTQVK